MSFGYKIILTALRSEFNLLAPALSIGADTKMISQFKIPCLRLGLIPLLLIGYISAQPNLIHFKPYSKLQNEDFAFDILLDSSFSTQETPGTLAYHITQTPKSIRVSLFGSVLHAIPNLDFNGIDTLKILATGHSGKSLQGVFILDVQAINDPPKILKRITDTTVNYFQGLKLNMSEFFDDIDRVTNGDKLEYTVSPGQSAYSYTIAGEMLTLTPELAYGNQRITVTARDAEAESQSITFTTNFGGPLRKSAVFPLPSFDNFYSTLSAVRIKPGNFFALLYDQKALLLNSVGELQVRPLRVAGSGLGTNFADRGIVFTSASDYKTEDTLNFFGSLNGKMQIHSLIYPRSQRIQLIDLQGASNDTIVFVKYADSTATLIFNRVSDKVESEFKFDFSDCISVNKALAYKGRRYTFWNKGMEKYAGAPSMFDPHNALMARMFTDNYRTSLGSFNITHRANDFAPTGTFFSSNYFIDAFIRNEKIYYFWTQHWVAKAQSSTERKDSVFCSVFDLDLHPLKEYGFVGEGWYLGVGRHVEKNDTLGENVYTISNLMGGGGWTENLDFDLETFKSNPYRVEPFGSYIPYKIPIQFPDGNSFLVDKKKGDAIVLGTFFIDQKPIAILPRNFDQKIQKKPKGTRSNAQKTNDSWMMNGYGVDGRRMINRPSYLKIIP